MVIKQTIVVFTLVTVPTLAAWTLLSIVGIQIFLALLLGFLPVFLKKKWYRWFYILYNTLPRDFIAAKRFTAVNVALYKCEKKKLTVPAIWMRLVKKHPNKIAFYFEDSKWTYREVEDFSNKIANYFKKEGFQHGDTVALFMETRVEYLCIWLGLAKIGVVTALINSNLRKYPLVHSITVSNSKAVIFSSDVKEAINDVYDDIKSMKFYQFNTQENVELLKMAVNLQANFQGENIDPPLDDIKKIQVKDKLIYVYTSGTTGLPKAAVITNMRYMFMTIASHYMLGLQQDDIIYDPLPLYHSAGGIVGAGQSVLCGITVALRKKFSASNFWKDCIKYNCTAAQYIGEICRYLLAVPTKDPSEKEHKLRTMFGNGLRPQIWKAFTERFCIKEVAEFYGATEGNSNIVNFDGVPGAVGFKPRYIGNLYPIFLIKHDEETGTPLRNSQGFCIKCKPNEPGIFIGKITPRKAVNDFEGYTDKSATKKKVLTNVFKEGDCFFNSGDILVMDEFGYLYFRDRTGDTFRWRGENVATSEVEAVISNVVSLQDAAVYGVQVPHTEGRCGMAAIVDPYNALDIEKLTKGLKQNLPSYACPLFLRIMKEVPLTGTFKLKKVDLQQEGYNPNKIKDKLYFYDAKKGEFVLLDEKMFEDIESGKIRL